MSAGGAKFHQDSVARQRHEGKSSLVIQPKGMQPPQRHGPDPAAQGWKLERPHLGRCRSPDHAMVVRQSATRDSSESMHMTKLQGPAQWPCLTANSREIPHNDKSACRGGFTHWPTDWLTLREGSAATTTSWLQTSAMISSFSAAASVTPACSLPTGIQNRLSAPPITSGRKPRPRRAHGD